MERSEIREEPANWQCCSRISLTLHAGYELCILVESKENRPLFAALGQGVARIPVFSLPPKRGGRRADKAHCPDYSGRVSGLLRTMRCIANAPPRLSARQRGILAFKPLTVVGPGRLLVAGEAARVRPGDGGCVRPSLAGAAPVPRLQNASGRRPSKSGSGWPKHNYAESEVKHYFTPGVFLYGE